MFHSANISAEDTHGQLVASYLVVARSMLSQIYLKKCIFIHQHIYTNKTTCSLPLCSGYTSAALSDGVPKDQLVTLILTGKVNSCPSFMTLSSF